MDAARSLLMLLGIVLHAAHIYKTNSGWNVHDPGGSPAFDLLVAVIHCFRMPAFFIAAGFFALLTLQRYGPAGFYRRRLARLGMPLLVTALSLNSAQALIAGSTPGPGSLAYWLGGGWISHLWFLLDLMVYCTLAYGLACCTGLSRALGGLVRRLAPLLEGPRGGWTLLLLVLPATELSLAALTKAHPPLRAPLLALGPMTVDDLLRYGLYFAFGAVLHLRRDLLDRFAASSVRLLAVLAAAVAAQAMLPEPHGLALRLAHRYAEAVIAWHGCALVFQMFRTFCDRQSATFAYLADASYTIYLTHHLTVIMLGQALLAVPAPAVIKFAVIVIATFVLTLTFHHHAVRGSATITFLLNGRGRPWRLAGLAALRAARSRPSGARRRTAGCRRPPGRSRWRHGSPDRAGRRWRCRPAAPSPRSP
jgi:glucan biosynthesis protein C